MRRGILRVTLRNSFGAIGLLVMLASSSLPARHAFAATPPTGVVTPSTGSVTPASDFSLQVTPSPLVTTVQPGVVTKVDLKIRNAGTGTEELKVQPRSFTFNSSNGQVDISDTTPPDIAKWVTFSDATPTIRSGEWLTEEVTIALPKDSGFSYSFALVISRKNNPAPVKGSRILQGSLAVFTLVNVDRPGATSKLQVTKLTTDKHVYEFLPTTISVSFKNVGNTIVQPYGNIFVQRSSSSKTPIATLPVNDKKSYILPGTERATTATWITGFPVYKTTTDDNGKAHSSLLFDWNKLSNFRFGKYTVKLVAVYSDGQHDVPIEGEVSFWVIPWRSILILLAAITLLWFFFRWRAKRRTEKAVKRALAAAKKAEQILKTSKHNDDKEHKDHSGADNA